MQSISVVRKGLKKSISTFGDVVAQEFTSEYSFESGRIGKHVSDVALKILGHPRNLAVREKKAHSLVKKRFNEKLGILTEAIETLSVLQVEVALIQEEFLHGISFVETSLGTPGDGRFTGSNFWSAYVGLAGKVESKVEEDNLPKFDEEFLAYAKSDFTKFEKFGMKFEDFYKRFKSTPKSYANVSSEKKKHVAWGDEEDDDEIDQLFSVHASYDSDGEKGASTANAMAVPADFDQVLPIHYKAIEKQARKVGITLTKASEKFSGSSFVGTSLYANSNPKDIAAGLKSMDKAVARRLVTFSTFLLSVHFNPVDIRENAETCAVSDYFIARYIKLTQKSPNAKRLTEISMKGDGKAALKKQIEDCFPLKHAVGTMLFDLVCEIVDRLIKKRSQKDQKFFEEASKKAFTNLNGMLTNCQRVVQKRQTRRVEKVTRGKKQFVTESFMKKGRDAPIIKQSDIPLKPEEIEHLAKAAKEFNNYQGVAQSVVDTIVKQHKTASENIFLSATVAKVVIELAYTKVAFLRRISRDRRNAIREKAEKSMPANQQKITQGDWLKAATEILSSLKISINEKALEPLKWNLDVIVEKVLRELEDT
jgi:hypothetical protein